MVNITMKQLLEAGVHFGHQSRRWNPKMKPYIYTERNGIYIIDLKKTLKMLRDACRFVRDAVADGKTVLFVGTKKTGKRFHLRSCARLQHVLRQQPLARWHVDQFPDCSTKRDALA